MCDIHAMNTQQADTKYRQRSKEFPTKTQANKAKPTGYCSMYNIDAQAISHMAQTTRKKRNGMWVFLQGKAKQIKKVGVCSNG